MNKRTGKGMVRGLASLSLVLGVLYASNAGAYTREPDDPQASKEVKKMTSAKGLAKSAALARDPLNMVFSKSDWRGNTNWAGGYALNVTQAGWFNPTDKTSSTYLGAHAHVDAWVLGRYVDVARVSAEFATYNHEKKAKHDFAVYLFGNKVASDKREHKLRAKLKKDFLSKDVPIKS